MREVLSKLHGILNTFASNWTLCATNFITNYMKYLIHADLGEYFYFNMIIYKYLIIKHLVS